MPIDRVYDDLNNGAAIGIPNWDQEDHCLRLRLSAARQEQRVPVGADAIDTKRIKDENASRGLI